jgi:hypothetical protein
VGGLSRRRLLATGAALALGAVLGRAGAAAAAPLACGVPPHEPLPFASPDPSVRWAATPAEAVVRIIHADGSYRYTVDGRFQPIRGMGYNPPETFTSTADRRLRLARDLGLMAAAGVNTLIGWNPAVIDGLALDVAQQAGLGVALPFDVDFTLDVRDAGVRRAFTDAVLGWVDQYRHHPALRVWAVGNEVLQRSVPPTWCGTAPSSRQSAWADAWSTLLVETADLIHARDPHHPVLYREAEDSYALWLARALAANPADRPWLVYGVNAYTPRLAEILDGWPERGVPTSLLVSEYAPLNAPRGERADQFRDIWGTIRARSSFVLGGAAYVWSTDGPEEVDRAFGLVDAGGTPVDDALDAISALYHADDRAGSLTPKPASSFSRQRSPMDEVWRAQRDLAAAPGSRARSGGDRDDG